MHPTARWYLVCYDVADDKARTRLYKTLRGYGTHLQYSVFRCALTPERLATLRAVAEGLIEAQHDQVLFVALGRAERAESWQAVVVGRPLPPLKRAARIFG